MGDTPNEYTEHYGLRKWADHANPGADGLNANWDDIDTILFNMLDLRGANIQKTDQILKGNLTLETGREFSADILKVTEITERITDNGIDIGGVHFQNENIDNVNILTATSIEIENLHNYGGSVFDDTAIFNDPVTFNDDVTFNSEIVVRNITAQQNPLDIEGISFYDGRIHALSMPIDNDEPATKGYVDQKTQGLDWQESVLDKDLTSPPSNPHVGDRYLLYNAPNTGTVWENHHKEIAEWNGSQWVFFSPNAGWTVNVEDEDKYYNYNNAGNWILMANLFSHNAMSNLQGGESNQYFHLSYQQYNDTLNLINNGVIDSFDTLYDKQEGEDRIINIDDKDIIFNMISGKNVKFKSSEQGAYELKIHGILLDFLGYGKINVESGPIDIIAPMGINFSTATNNTSIDNIIGTLNQKLNSSVVKTVINDTNDEVPTSKAVKYYFDNKNFLQDGNTKFIVTEDDSDPYNLKSYFNFVSFNNDLFFRIENYGKFKPLYFNFAHHENVIFNTANLITFYGMTKFVGSIGFFNTPPAGKTLVSNADDILTSETADSTYDQTEVDMLNNLKQDVINLQSKLNELLNALRGYGLI